MPRGGAAPLVADARALEREAACEDAFELDAAALDAAFEPGGGPLDVEGPRRRSRRPARRPGPGRQDDDDDNTKGESAADALARYAALASKALGGLFSPKAKTATKTGWASIGGRRKWLALDRASCGRPRIPMCEPALARLDRVRQARRDASLEITLRVSDDQRRGADGVVLKFDTPSKCVAWWTALSARAPRGPRRRGWQSALYESVATEKPFWASGRQLLDDGARDGRLAAREGLSMAGPDAKAAYSPAQGHHPAAARDVRREAARAVRLFRVKRVARAPRGLCRAERPRARGPGVALGALEKSDTPPPCVVYAHGNAFDD